MSRDIYTEANEHFLKSGVGYEYGRPDMAMKNGSANGKTDGSRTEQDNDHDGLRGVDCSSFVWRGLKNAGYDVGNAPFGTHDLYTGKNTTPYAEKHFDVIGGADAAKHHGDLQAGDILMLKSKHGSGQHVGIVKGYDEKGNIQFIGSQTSTGPAEVTIKPGGYWEKNMEIVGALRAKPEFRTHEPVHGKGGAEPASPAHTAAKPATAAHAAPTAQGHDNVLSKGDNGAKVHALQESLSRLGYKDENGNALKADSDFGAHTKAAVERFQRDNHLGVDGVAGPKTLDALREKTQGAHRLDSAGHDDHGMFQQARSNVHRLDAEHQRAPDHRSENIAGALTAEAKRQGLTQIDHVVLSDDATRIYAVQGDLNSPLKRVAEVPVQQAVGTSVEQSTQAIAQQKPPQEHAQQQAQQQDHQQTQQSQQQAQAQTMGR